MTETGEVQTDISQPEEEATLEVIHKGEELQREEVDHHQIETVGGLMVSNGGQFFLKCNNNLVKGIIYKMELIPDGENCYCVVGDQETESKRESSTPCFKIKENEKASIFSTTVSSPSRQGREDSLSHPPMGKAQVIAVQAPVTSSFDTTSQEADNRIFPYIRNL